MPIAVKDVLATRGLPTTCGSRILEGWVPPYDATVVARLRAAGLPILGKTNMDEFAMGSSTEHSAYGPTHNPWDLDRIPGGSGGGSAAAVAAFEAPLAIGTDTGGSIRQPGAVTGTVGVKPTYGGVSRYGLVALANSLDQAGPVTRTVLDAALLHEVIGGHDPLDSTCIDQPLPDLVGAARRGADGDLTGVRIGVVTELGGEGYQAGVLARFHESVELLAKAGAEVVEVSCPHFVHALATYYLILPAEASSNLARFDAMRYGLRVTPDGDPSAEDVMRATREAGFGDEVKRRIILGTYALSSGYYDAYYGQAQKVRTLIARDFEAAFEQADVLVSPTAPTTAFKLGEKLDDPLAMYLNDLATIPANLAGRPRDLGAQRAGRRGRPARRRPDPGAGDGRRPRVPRRRGARGRAAAPVGRPAARPGADPPVGEPVATTGGAADDRRPAVLRRRARAVRPGARARGPRRAEHRDEDVLRLPDGVRRRAQHPDLPDLPGPAGLDAGGQREGRRVRDPDRAGAELRDRGVVPVRPEELLLPGHAEELPDLASTTSRSRSRATWTSRSTGTTYRVEIERAHMEEDTGKSLHVGGSTGRIHGADYSLVDYNRAGIPLIEIVTKPVLGTGEKAPEVARAYVAQLRELLLGLGVSDVRMEQGSLRCDVNLSLAPKDAGRLGTRTETKNVNSLRSVERAVRYEIRRHAAILAGGGSILQETRHWHEDTGVTTSGREKSDAEDYRYFPEPDLVPVAPSREWVEELRGDAARAAAREAGPAAGGVGLLRPGDARHRRRRRARPGRGDRSRPARPRRPPASGGSASSPGAPTSRDRPRRRSASRRPTSRRVQALVDEGTLNDKLARQVLDGVLAGEGTPDEIVAARGLGVVSDDGALGAAVDSAIAANPDVAEKIRDGKVAAAGALIGAVMKEMRGQADAARVRELILDRLG